MLLTVLTRALTELHLSSWKKRPADRVVQVAVLGWKKVLVLVAEVEMEYQKYRHCLSIHCY
jgi:hypothetical protein